MDVAYFRNRVRWELLPLLESKYNSNVRGALVRLALTAAEDEAYLRSAADKVLERSMAQAGARSGSGSGAGGRRGSRASPAES